jgi:hypothetical protein
MKKAALSVLLATAVGAGALALGGFLLAQGSPNGVAQGRGIATALLGGLVGGALGLCIGLAREAMRPRK